jgi:hypothetical protein
LVRRIGASKTGIRSVLPPEAGSASDRRTAAARTDSTVSPYGSDHLKFEPRGYPQNLWITLWMACGILRETALLLILLFVLFNYSAALSPHDDKQK